jgi:hypothetical protein
LKDRGAGVFSPFCGVGFSRCDCLVSVDDEGGDVVREPAGEDAVCTLVADLGQDSFTEPNDRIVSGP